VVSLPPAVLHALQNAVGSANVITDPTLLSVWERDGSVARGLPDAVVFPGCTKEVAAVVRAAAVHGVPLVARGAGSGLSGGAVTVFGGIALSTSRMRRILEIEPDRRWAIVEPGVANGDLNAAAGRHGLFYAPDPSSRRTCTIGGNAAENAGGPRSLLYGVTGHHVIALEVVFADGAVRWIGGEAPDPVGLDLLGIVIGSEGTLAIITKIQTRLVPMPEAAATVAAAFDSVGAANASVSCLLVSGLGPASVEIMDRPTVAAVEEKYRVGYPANAGAVLITELHGTAAGTREMVGDTTSMLRAGGGHGLLVAPDPDAAEPIWRSRQGAISALARIQPNFYLHDLVVPRTSVPAMVEAADRIGRSCRVPVASVVHAGDGNLHPTLLYDARVPGALEAVAEAGEEMLRACVAAGGTLSGEHGIGVEKNALLSWIHGPRELEAMAQVKRAFDPAGVLNPGKILPPGRPIATAPARTGSTQEAEWW
jgi:glycolate oxidase